MTTTTMAEKFKMSRPRPMCWLRKVTVEPVLFLYMFSLYLLFGVFQGHYSIDFFALWVQTNFCPII